MPYHLVLFRPLTQDRVANDNVPALGTRTPPTPAKLQNALLVLSIVASVAMAGCDRRQQTHGDSALRVRAATSSAASQVTAAPSATSSAAPIAVEPPSTAALSAELRSLLTRWFDATNASDVAQLTDLYMPELVFYGRPLSRSEAIARKRNAHSGTSALLEELSIRPDIYPTIAGPHAHRIRKTRRERTQG
jgi:hypothetical protein